jgi:hypothetical protein
MTKPITPTSCLADTAFMVGIAVILFNAQLLILPPQSAPRAETILCLIVDTSA